MRHDLRHAVRVLVRSPGFTVVAIAALAVGIGANLTIFGVVNAVLFHPIEAVEPNRLVRVGLNGPNVIENLVSFDEYMTYRDRNQTLSSVALFHWGGIAPVRTAVRPAEPIHVMPVTGNYFGTLGVRAALGRTIAPSDDRPGAPRVAVLSAVGWTRHFDGDAAIVGQPIYVFGAPFTVVGVMPEAFTGTTFPVIPRIYLPWAHSAPPPSVSRGGQLIGRLRPGATLQSAQADAARIATQIAAEQKRPPFGLTVFAGGSAFPAPTSTQTLLVASLFMVIVGSVLWVACSNLAILQLARTAARRREMAIRLAIGASRFQLLRQVLVEMLLLAAVSSAAAIALALVTGQWVTRLQAPVPMPLGLPFYFDTRVALMAGGLTLIATLLSGLGAALDSHRTSAGNVLLHESSESAGARVRTSLIVTQVAVATVLLVVAASLGFSLVVPQDRGFNADRILVATVPLPAARYSPEQSRTFFDRLLAETVRASDVESATLVYTVPLANNRLLGRVSLTADANARDPSRAPASALMNFVSPAHFSTLGIPLLGGRDFRTDDALTTPAVGVINQTLANRMWPGEPVVGRQLHANDQWVTVVGVVGDSKYERLDEAPTPFLYRPFAQAAMPMLEGTLLIKTAGAPQLSAPLVRERVAALDRDIAVTNLIPFEDRLGMAVLPNRTGATLAGALGAIALGLGTIGTYSIMAFLVLQRRREIGIRIALGGLPSAVSAMIARQGLQWIAVGLAGGAAVGIAILRVLQGRMFGVSPADPLPIVAVIVLLGTTGYLACVLPARRAAKGDPLAVLRQ